MTDTLRGAAEALRRTGDALADAGARLAVTDPGARALGGEAPGALGEVARDLHAVLQRAIGARTREAAAHGARVAAAADAVARASGAYDDVEARPRPRGVT